KAARFLRNTGGEEDTTVKKILSPYPQDRGALSDCAKLARSGIAARRAILIYGFDYPDRGRRVRPLIEAFEALARERVTLSPRVTAPFAGLIHRYHRAGEVFAWEVSARVGAEPDAGAWRCPSTWLVFRPSERDGPERARRGTDSASVRLGSGRPTSSAPSS